LENKQIKNKTELIIILDKNTLKQLLLLILLLEVDKVLEVSLIEEN